MKAAVLRGPKDLIVEDIPVFEIAEDDVMIQVEACGVCGSDLRYYLGENPWALHAKGTEIPNPPNIVLGHEFVGRVVRPGGELGATLVGKRVAVLPYRLCATCYSCRHGMHNLCPNVKHHGHGAGWGKMDYYPGGMAEYCPAWVGQCYVIPEDLTAAEAAFADSLAVAVHALRTAGFRAGWNVAVFGCGPIGMGIAAVAKAWGARDVFCVDMYKVALDIAREVVGDHTIDNRSADPVTYIQTHTDGEGVRYAFDTVCTVRTQQQVLSTLGLQGVLVNMATKNLDIDFNLTALGGERMVRGSSNYLIPEFQLALELLASGQVNTLSQITHRVKLQEVPKAFEMLLCKQETGAFKAIVEPQV